ncbi:MAG: GMC family oxidoreductase [Acidobacteria bacterium]|nr:GMC family oxidoreductase [Acidobacteriota bacterium]
MKPYDAIVVGSGFGGAVVACRLAERGRSVLVLERGRRWARQDFPRPGQKDAPWWFEADEAPVANQTSARWGRHSCLPARTGLFERRRFPSMQVIVASGVGGGSLVYTNVQKVPPAEAFRGWPAPLALDYLRSCYERVREMLEPAPIPHDLERIRAFEAVHRRAGLADRVERPPLAIYWGEGDAERLNRFGAPQLPCNLCGLCLAGCDRHSKNTLDLTYLKRAEALGAEVWPLCEVVRIAPRDSGYEVVFRRLAGGTEAGKQGSKPFAPRSGAHDKEAGRQGEEKVVARAVFLAAGSLGSTELLLRARDLDRTLPNLSPRLGSNWSPNGDFFALLLDSALPIQPTVGPSVAAACDASDAGFYALEGAIPSSLATGHRTTVTWITRLVSWLRLSFLRRAREAAETRSCGDEEAERLLAYMGSFFLMGRDESSGRLVLDPSGCLQLLWHPAAGEALFARMRRYLEELGRAYGGAMLIPQPWWPLSPGTVHPLGGCPMGRDPSDGVVDSYGRVFGYSNLYICDASIIPRALGVPPAMTIAALAEHIAEHVTRSP